MKIAMAQIEVIPGHPDKNTETMLRLINEAKEKGVQLIIFPEMLSNLTDGNIPLTYTLYIIKYSCLLSRSICLCMIHINITLPF